MTKNIEEIFKGKLNEWKVMKYDVKWWAVFYKIIIYVNGYVISNSSINKHKNSNAYNCRGLCVSENDGM